MRRRSARLVMRTDAPRSRTTTPATSPLLSLPVSVLGPVAATPLRSRPGCCGRMPTVIVTLPPAGIVPSSQVGGGPASQVPWLMSTETTSTSKTGVSTTTTSSAGPSPRFSTTTR